MDKVKAGDSVVIDDKVFEIPEDSVQAVNIWLECFEHGISDEGTIGIPLLATDGTGYGYFVPSVIVRGLQQN